MQLLTKFLFIAFKFANDLKVVFYLMYFYGRKLLFNIILFTKNSYKIYLPYSALERISYISPAATFYIQNNSEI
jgi:hypothetical protein